MDDHNRSMIMSEHNNQQTGNHIPVWDPARPRRARFVEWLPFQRLDAPYKIEGALNSGAASFIVIMITNIISALVGLWGPIRETTLLFGRAEAGVFTGNMIMAAVALGLYFLSKKNRSIALYVVALAWSVLELFPNVTYPLYGHGSPFLLSLIGLLCALSGLCGAVAANRALRNPQVQI